MSMILGGLMIISMIVPILIKRSRRTAYLKLLPQQESEHGKNRLQDAA